MTRPLRVVEDEEAAQPTPYEPNVGLALLGGLLRPLAWTFDRLDELRTWWRGEPVCSICHGSERVGDAECWACSEDDEPRPAGCQCQWEAGDSPCRVHGEGEP